METSRFWNCLFFFPFPFTMKQKFHSHFFFFFFFPAPQPLWFYPPSNKISALCRLMSYSSPPPPFPLNWLSSEYPPWHTIFPKVNSSSLVNLYDTYWVARSFVPPLFFANFHTSFFSPFPKGDLLLISEIVITDFLLPPLFSPPPSLTNKDALLFILIPP